MSSLYLRDREIKSLTEPSPTKKDIKILHASSNPARIQAAANSLQTELDKPSQSVTLAQAQAFIDHDQRIETESLTIGRASFPEGEAERGISILPRRGAMDRVVDNIKALKIRLK
jgi:hypothetical protein